MSDTHQLFSLVEQTRLGTLSNDQSSSNGMGVGCPSDGGISREIPDWGFKDFARVVERATNSAEWPIDGWFTISVWFGRSFRGNFRVNEPIMEDLMFWGDRVGTRMRAGLTKNHLVPWEDIEDFAFWSDDFVFVEFCPRMLGGSLPPLHLQRWLFPEIPDAPETDDDMRLKPLAAEVMEYSAYLAEMGTQVTGPLVERDIEDSSNNQVKLFFEFIAGLCDQDVPADKHVSVDFASRIFNDVPMNKEVLQRMFVWCDRLPLRLLVESTLGRMPLRDFISCGAALTCIVKIIVIPLILGGKPKGQKKNKATLGQVKHLEELIMSRVRKMTLNQGIKNVAKKQAGGLVKKAVKTVATKAAIPAPVSKLAIACVDAFDPRAKGAYIPNVHAKPSLKSHYLLKTSVSLSTAANAGSLFILIGPNLANDYNSIVAIEVPYGFGTNAINSNVGVIVQPEKFNTMFSSTELLADTSKQVRGSVFQIKVTYQGKLLERAGMYKILRMGPDQQIITSATTGVGSGLISSTATWDALRVLINANQHTRNVAIDGSPIDLNITAPHDCPFREVGKFPMCGDGGTTDNCTPGGATLWGGVNAVILIEGTSPLSVFRVAAIMHNEQRASNLIGVHSPSPAHLAETHKLLSDVSLAHETHAQQDHKPMKEHLVSELKKSGVLGQIEKGGFNFLKKNGASLAMAAFV